MTIHKASKDPVLIKKIALKIWSLRTEIEEVLKFRLKEADKRGLTSPPIDDLVEEYQGNVSPQEIEAIFKNIKASDDSDENEGEDEEGEGGEGEGDEEGESSEESDDNLVIQRTPEIPEEKITRGKTLLSEINMEFLFLFSEDTFIEGRNVVVKFLIPKTFSLNAQVIHCRKHTMSSRIISNQKLPHRACFKFTFLKPGEKSLLRQFLLSIEPEKAVVQQSEEKQGSEGDDDDFGELDDLDM